MCNAVGRLNFTETRVYPAFLFLCARRLEEEYATVSHCSWFIILRDTFCKEVAVFISYPFWELGKFSR